MFELSRHIETLLLEHDCVIIPGLGGFIAQNVPARYIADEQLYLPPYRCVSFNDRLNLNDGVLVQSFMRMHHVSYTQSLLMIERAVSDLKQSLNVHTEVIFGNLGTFSLNQHGNYVFTPSESGITTPGLYGLDSFAIVSKNIQEVKVHRKPSLRDGSNYVLRLNKELVNYAAAIFVAVMFYFAWATPLEHHVIDSPAPIQASVLPERATNEVQPQPMAQPVNEIVESVETVTTSEEEKPAEIEKTAEHFTIVMASCIPMKNAIHYAETLQQNGLSQCDVYANQKMVRVVCGTYATESEAYIQLHRLRTTYPKHFASAWVLKIKETKGVQ